MENSGPDQRLRFSVTEEQVTDEQGNNVTLYGLAVHRVEGNLTWCFSALTGDGARLRAFASLCERSDLSPVHLEDVVEDFLGGLYGQ